MRLTDGRLMTAEKLSFLREMSAMGELRKPGFELVLGETDESLIVVHHGLLF